MKRKKEEKREKRGKRTGQLKIVFSSDFYYVLCIMYLVGI